MKRGCMVPFTTVKQIRRGGRQYLGLCTRTQVNMKLIESYLKIESDPAIP